MLELFQPVLVEVGARWAPRRCRRVVAEGRFATNFIRQRLISLLQLHAPFAQGPRLILACPAGEEHEIGMLTFAVLMEQRGWEVIYLGQSVAPDGLAPFLERLTPALLCLSVALVEHVPGLIDTCRQAEPLCQQGLLVAFGGRVFDQYPEFAERVPGLFLTNDLHQALRRTETLAETIDRERWLNTASISTMPSELLHLAIGS